MKTHKIMQLGMALGILAFGLGLASSDTYTYNFETKGLVGSFNASSNTFAVGGHTVKVDAKTRYEYQDASITAARFWNTNRNGQWVEVKGNRVGNTVTALSIELDTPAYNFETKGSVRLFNASSNTFVVSGYTVKVDAQTRYEYQDAAITAARFWSANRNGRWVQVKGNRVGNTVTALSIELDTNTSSND